MPELEILIGGREYRVACAEGEELHLRTAASALNAEAEIVQSAAGSVPETRMLLMAGLMLGDKMAAIAEYERVADEKVAAMEKQLKKAEAAAAKQDAQPAVVANTMPGLPLGDGATAPDLTQLARVADELEGIADQVEAAIRT